MYRISLVIRQSVFPYKTDLDFWDCFGRVKLCVCVVVVLRPRYTSKVMLGWSVNLTTLFLGRLRPP